MHYLLYDLQRPAPSLLSPADLDPREQAAYAARGERYLHIRSLLKQELQRLIGIPAAEIRFAYSEHGKPLLDAQPFSLSHSGDLLCLAFHHCRCGVDIERVRPRARMAAIAARTMCAEQYAAWRARGADEQEFYACWCAAEAIVKLYGSAVWQARRYPFLYRSGSIEPLGEDTPQVELFCPAEGYMGAVATEG